MVEPARVRVNLGTLVVPAVAGVDEAELRALIGQELSRLIAGGRPLDRPPTHPGASAADLAGWVAATLYDRIGPNVGGRREAASPQEAREHGFSSQRGAATRSQRPPVPEQ
jgi:hypothetical protein